MIDKEERTSNLTKRYLSQIFYIKEIIRANEEKIREKRDLLKNNIKPIDYAKEQIKGGNKYSWENLIHEVDMLERELFDNTVKQVKKEREIYNCIDSVKDYQYKLLLQLRYFNCKEWLEIDQIMGIEANTRNRKHSEALRAIKIDNLPKHFPKVSKSKKK